MKKRPLCLVCIGLMIAIWLCRIGGIPIFGEPRLTEEEKVRLSGGQPVTLIGVITDRRISSSTIRYTLRQTRVTICDRQIPFSGILVSTEYTEESSAAEPGDRIRVSGELHPLEHADNPGQFDAAGYYACQKIHYRLWSEKAPEIQVNQSVRKELFRLRERLTEIYAESMHEGSAGILSAMLLGDRAFLTEESRRNFQVGGCLHLLVISGLHVMLLGMGLLQILLRLRLPQTPACVLASGGMIFYTALTGFPIAAVRACIMFLVLMFARVLRRSYDSACAMAFAAVFLLLTNPGYLFHSGFQLSFAAAGAASLVSPLLNRCLCERVSEEDGTEGRSSGRGKSEKNGTGEGLTTGERIGRSVLRKVKENTILWGAVQLCTLPLTAYYFYEVPVWGLPLNLLLVPCMQYVLGAGVFGSMAAVVFPRAGKWLLLPADLGLESLDRMLRLVRILPGSSVICGQPAHGQIVAWYGALFVVLYVLHREYGRGEKNTERRWYGKNGKNDRRVHGRRNWRKRTYCAILLTVACAVLFSRRHPAFSLTMLDVGQGDCLIIQTGRNVFLSDGGSTNIQEVGKYRILPWLESKGIRYVEGICLSHNDSDHINGIEEILRLIAERQTALRIGHVYMPGWMAQTEEGMRIAAEAEAAGTKTGVLERGDVLSAGALSVEVLHPFRNGRGVQAGNAGSVVLQLTYRRFTALLTGDLEKEGEDELLPYLSDIDCLKAGHHGSRWSSSEEFLAATQPEIVLISAPEKSVYGHPHQETIDRLGKIGASLFITKDCGAVEIEVKKNSDTGVLRQWKEPKR